MPAIYERHQSWEPELFSEEEIHGQSLLQISGDVCLTGLGVFLGSLGSELDALEFFPGLTSAQGMMSCLPVRAVLLWNYLPGGEGASCAWDVGLARAALGRGWVGTHGHCLSRSL